MRVYTVHACPQRFQELAFRCGCSLALPAAWTASKVTRMGERAIDIALQNSEEVVGRIVWQNNGLSVDIWTFGSRKGILQCRLSCHCGIIGVGDLESWGLGDGYIWRWGENL